MDYNLQEKLNEINDEEDGVENLIGQEIEEAEENFKNAMKKPGEDLSAEAKMKEDEKEHAEVTEHA